MISNEDKARDVLDLLIKERPAFHDDDVATSLHVLDDVLHWLVSVLGDEATTLETGCGATTVAFLAKGSYHTVISPLAKEHERIQAWCGSHGISTERASFILATSEAVLPTMEPTSLEIIFIDGSHCFPIPFIDWYYTANRLKVGGFVVIDDTNIRACGVLRDFLRSEKGRWEPAAEFWRTSVFRKVAERVGVGDAFTLQPWNCRSATWGDRLKRVVHSVARGTIGTSPRMKRIAYRIYHRFSLGGREQDRHDRP
jgi:hypothetical protein